MTIELTGIKGVLYIVRPDTIRNWTWFWTECMGGSLVRKLDDVAPNNPDWSSMHWTISFSEFDIILSAGISKNREHPATDFANKNGDHAVRGILLSTEASREEILGSSVRKALLTRKVLLQTVEDGTRKIKPQSSRRQWLRRIDHITYPVPIDMIDEETEFWTKEMGGELTLQNDDVLAQGGDSGGNDPSDSMMLRGITFNKGNPQTKFGIALVAGIDRREKSHVTRYIEKHGLCSIQHVAFDVGNMNAFRAHFARHLAGNLISETLFVSDGFGGFVEQVFGYGYAGENFDESQFPEFLSRTHEAAAAAQFKAKAGMGLYEHARNASEKEPKPLIDFSRVPGDWEPVLYGTDVA